MLTLDHQWQPDIGCIGDTPQGLLCKRLLLMRLEALVVDHPCLGIIRKNESYRFFHNMNLVVTLLGYSVSNRHPIVVRPHDQIVIDGFDTWFPVHLHHAEKSLIAMILNLAPPTGNNRLPFLLDRVGMHRFTNSVSP
ncbi:MAG: hypothetical protein BWY82_02842 [Verrucomicrobia bacterium ADurb.Bin474]|nr:MAG: hypothetical protein BWY82_02842 [Verrucomicrobia bacterium ADurb.Bin474]